MRYQSWYRYQRHSQELVIYCEATRSVVKIAWPLSSHGIRIRPEYILQWLRDRCLAWFCFCQHEAEDDEERPCQIGDDIDGGDTGAYCHFSPSRCGFAMNLTRLYRDATLESDYSHFCPHIEDPTTQYENLLQAFEDQDHQPDPDSDITFSDEGSPPVGSYFEGFCGALFGHSQQLRANFHTHSFQRQLNNERCAIREHRLHAARVLEFYHNQAVGWGVRWDDLDQAGITDEDINAFYARNLRFS
ncbi:hypothetical protein BKA70DRAFT_1440294 [Coprinopsis sp. MPI-PUGE-AT-0042]|nr:hypothetical protein BKA70DRAFT_1440294 [Coprinopsis sp. MPI-PUGE-AT-0042]